jgi:hypothetical protein
MIREGLCQCGCGEKTRIADRSNKEKGWVKGSPLRFVNHHQCRGSNHGHWKGGLHKQAGYVFVKQLDHPKAGTSGYVQVHVLEAERVLGKYLPENAVIHHANEIKDDNDPSNLVICQDLAYHNLLHQRMRAIKACGHATWLKCSFCHQYDDPVNLRHYENVKGSHHASCKRKYDREDYPARYVRDKIRKEKRT